MKLLNTLFLFLFVTITNAQISILPEGPVERTNPNLNTWFMAVGNLRFADQWSFELELHERQNATFEKQGHYILRPSINYHFKDNARFTAGYSYIDFNADDFYKLPVNRHEHNIWAQAMFDFTVGKTKIINRFRQEHKWPQKIVTTEESIYTDGYGYLNRFRVMVLLQRDIWKLKNEQALFGLLLDELWINQTDNLIPQTLNRNWLSLGLGYRFNKQHNIQLRYMHQYDILNQNLHLTTHIGQLVYFGTFDLRKNRK